LIVGSKAPGWIGRIGQERLAGNGRIAFRENHVPAW